MRLSIPNILSPSLRAAATATGVLILLALVLMRSYAYPTAPRPLLRGRVPPAVQLEAPPAPAVVAPQLFEQLAPDAAEAINASVPFSTLPNLPAKPFTLGAASSVDRARAAACLAMAVYYEAASESAAGQAAVAQVVLNRVRNPIFPKSVCGVVFQGSELATGCQFTFTCDGSLSRRPSEAAWKRAVQVAERALNGYVAKEVGEATHYHTQWVVPYWQTSVLKLTQIGAHIFYRWKGGLGLPSAFLATYGGGEMAPPPMKDFDTGLQTELAPVQPVEAALAAPAAPPAPVVKEPAMVKLAQADAGGTPALTPPATLKAAPTSYFGGDQGGAQRLPW
ncbi:MAG: cell wall hydrolase [Caulobacteraceae bacterium]|nr:cell wall hydrolase [Caulobacteraceae bacterium]